jgi:hypothetical protein
MAAVAGLLTSHNGPDRWGTDSVHSTSDGRLTEIAEILVAGLMRLRARESSTFLSGEADFSLETLARGTDLRISRPVAVHKGL